MKRLFKVNGIFFDSKKDAKKHRDEAMAYAVELGPDHWRYGVKGNPRTHSHNARSGGSGNGFPNKRK